MKSDTLNIEDLLNKIRLTDDRRSFEILFQHYFNKVYKVALSIVRRHEIAEEIVEDVFFKFWQKKESYPLIKDLDAYLYVAAKNGAYDYLKKTAKYRLDSHEHHVDALSHVISPERSYLIEELKDQINRAVGSLPPRCRQVFELIRYEGLTHREAAETLGVSIKTIENQMTLAIKKITRELEVYLRNSEKVPYKSLAIILFLYFLGFL